MKNGKTNEIKTGEKQNNGVRKNIRSFLLPEINLIINDSVRATHRAKQTENEFIAHNILQ